ncbi:MAG TPA: tetratricopeptide repeat protein [Bacteroidia bacterium]
MKNTRTLQLMIVVCSVLLFVLLFIANKKPEKKVEESPPTNGTSQLVADVKVYVDTIIAVLPEKAKKDYEVLVKKATDTTGINTLIDFFNKKKMPLVAAYYFQKKAELINSAKAWYDAGNRYFYAVSFANIKNVTQSLYKSAFFAYTQALAKNPDYTEAKIQLASCYVESTTDPMKGIGMLKEVERADSANTQVQMVLGAFAVKSSQFDKAEARYKKVIRIKPQYLEAYLFLADVYEKKGEKTKTIETLEKYVELTPDKEAKEQVKKYIQQLKINV